MLFLAVYSFTPRAARETGVVICLGFYVIINEPPYQILLSTHSPIPSPGTALGTAKNVKTNNSSQIMIRCCHDYPTMEELSAFILHSSMKDLRNSIVGDTVLHEVDRHKRMSERHAVPGHGISLRSSPKRQEPQYLEVIQ